jgi:tetratricopeptide (TPR) repeat protein
MMSEFFAMDPAQPGRRWLRGWLLVLFFAIAGARAAEKVEELTLPQRAEVAWQAGYVFHVLGDYERAAALFRASIDAHPTAEAHTFLGWSLSHLGRIKEAIAQCEIAIKLDPEFGNPYNDIGVYLIDLGRPEEAIPWLQKAIAAKRYCCYQFAHANLGRVLLAQGKVEEAARSFERALEHDPNYVPALVGLEYIKQSGLRGL